MWNGPNWLTQPPRAWPHQSDLPRIETTEERVCTLHILTQNKVPIIPIDHYSSYIKLKRVTACILCFVNNCRTNKNDCSLQSSSSLTTQELHTAETYWISIAQEDCFPKEIETIKESKILRSSCPLLSLHSILDSSGILCVGGRDCVKKVSYSSQHPVILSGKHPVTKLMVHFGHLRLRHAGPTLLACSLNHCFYILRGCKAIRSITHSCVICRCTSAKPQHQMLGQLPIECLIPDLVFDKVGVDYAGPFYIKHGHVRKPTVVKSYASVFVSLSLKAVHL